MIEHTHIKNYIRMCQPMDNFNFFQETLYVAITESFDFVVFFNCHLLTQPLGQENLTITSFSNELKDFELIFCDHTFDDYSFPCQIFRNFFYINSHLLSIVEHFFLCLWQLSSDSYEQEDDVEDDRSSLQWLLVSLSIERPNYFRLIYIILCTFCYCLIICLIN